MGYFFCKTCNTYWGSWTPESIAEHNVRHAYILLHPPEEKLMEALDKGVMGDEEDDGLEQEDFGGE